MDNFKAINVHEGSFEFTSNKEPIFDNIKGFLEMHNGKWVYKAYLEDDYEKQEDVGKMLALKLDRCN